MELWIGPVLVAAVVSSLVNMVGWLVTFRSTRRLDRVRREEKIRDFQIALRAEIRSELRNLSKYDIEAQLALVRGRYQAESGYAVSVPRPAKAAIFDALVGDIHILPEEVIDPVVLFSRQRLAIESLVEDMREPGFRGLSKDQQLAMYEDYLNMWAAWRDFAAQAETALNASGNQ